jgi:hypothetical protein
MVFMDSTPQGPEQPREPMNPLAQGGPCDPLGGMISPDEKSRREKLDRELEEMAASAKRQNTSRLIMTIVFIFGIIFLLVYVGRCSHDSIIGSQYNEARNEFVKVVKRIDAPIGSSFEQPKLLFDNILKNDPKFAECYIFKASMAVLEYDRGWARNRGTGNKAFLDEARKYCNAALLLKRNYADAYYYLGCVAYYEGTKDLAIQNINKCKEYASRTHGRGSKQAKEWEEKCDETIKVINTTPPMVRLDSKPVMEMMPGFISIN